MVADSEMASKFEMDTGSIFLGYVITVLTIFLNSNIMNVEWIVI